MQTILDNLVSPLVVGSAVAVFGFLNMLAILLRNRWPTAGGKILLNKKGRDFDLEYTETRFGSTRPLSIPKIVERVPYRVKYVFVVGKYKYESYQVFSSPIASLFQRQPLELKAGEYIKVYYKPSDPRHSFLFRSSVIPGLIMLLAGLAVVISAFIQT